MFSRYSRYSSVIFPSRFLHGSSIRLRSIQRASNLGSRRPVSLPPSLEFASPAYRSRLLDTTNRSLTAVTNILHPQPLMSPDGTGQYIHKHKSHDPRLLTTPANRTSGYARFLMLLARRIRDMFSCTNRRTVGLQFFAPYGDDLTLVGDSQARLVP